MNYVGKRQHFQESRTSHSVRQQPILQGRGWRSAVVAGRIEKHVVPGRDAFFNRPSSSFCASNIEYTSSMEFILKPWHGLRSIGVVVMA